MLKDIKKVLEVHFYAESSGNEPVRKWLYSLEDEDRKIIGDNILTIQYKWPIGMPLVRPFGEGLWEVRSELDNRISRVIFIVEHKKIILLHGFIKKTEKTPPHELELAEKRAHKYIKMVRIKK
jgi:phage-related protein